MKFVDILQRTPEWDAWKMHSIGSSDASAILGLSPYKTPYRVYLEKCAKVKPQDLSSNPFVAHGQRYEPLARAIWENQINDLILPVCIESDRDFIKASLDGMCGLNRPREIKCPFNASVFNDVLTFRKQSEAFKLYFPQVQHQIYCAESDMGYLGFLAPDFSYVLEVEVGRDDKFIGDMIGRYEEFNRRMLDQNPPALDPERDIYIPSGRDAALWSTAAYYYRLQHERVAQLKHELKQETDRLGVLRKPLEVQMGAYSKVDAAFVAITKYRRSKVDYRRIVQEKLQLTEADLNQYCDYSEDLYRVTLKDSPLPDDVLDDELLSSYQPLSKSGTGAFYF